MENTSLIELHSDKSGEEHINRPGKGVTTREEDPKRLQETV